MSESISGDNRHTTDHGRIETVAPENIGVDEMNERTENIDTTDLEQSVEDVGVLQPPLVRETDDPETEYTAVIGQRRVRAAKNVGVESVPVLVMDWSDKEALKASITENIDLFRQDVSIADRAQALQTYWDMLSDSEGSMPVQSHLGAELGVPRETVRTWLEPLHEGWKDSSIDPRSSKPTNPAIEELGERKLAEIRRMTGGGEAAEEAAELIAEAELTQEEVESVRDLVESGAPVAKAIEKVAADAEPDPLAAESDSPTEIEATVSFASDTSVAVSEYAQENDQEPATVIVDAVQWFLEAEGYL